LLTCTSHVKQEADSTIFFSTINKLASQLMPTLTTNVKIC
jgi:hypothetical protein